MSGKMRRVSEILVRLYAADTAGCDPEAELLVQQATCDIELALVAVGFTHRPKANERLSLAGAMQDTDGFSGLLGQLSDASESHGGSGMDQAKHLLRRAEVTLRIAQHRHFQNMHPLARRQ